MQFLKRIFKKNDNLQSHIEGCVKCGKIIFTYDDYFKEYMCENCGWTIGNKPLGNIEIIKKINKSSTNDIHKFENDFYNYILTIANRGLTEIGASRTDDIVKLSSIVVIDIMTKLHAEKIINPMVGFIAHHELTASSTLMCLVSANIGRYLNKNIEYLEIIAESGKAIYQLLEEEQMKFYIEQGFKNFQIIIDSLDSTESARSILESVGKTTILYVMSSGDDDYETQSKAIKIFANLFDDIKNSLE